MTRTFCRAVVAFGSLLAPLMSMPAAIAGLPGIARADMPISFPTVSTVKVCASGYVDDGSTLAGAWLFQIDGARSDGSDIHDLILYSGSVYDRPCYLVAKGPAGISGAFVATLSFVGAGTSDLTVAAVGSAQWGPSTGDRAEWLGF